jgi:SAM-dependent methyltransferase
MAAQAAIAAKVSDFYETHPYPAPKDDLEAYHRAWNDLRRRAESHLLWPHEPYRDDRSILVAGCGTRQAAHYAVRWPKARVVGIDVSDRSIAFEEELKRNHGLQNLEVRRLEIERAAELGEQFDHVVCTGVLHHLPDPDAGIRALLDVLSRNGAMHVMVYAPYGRAGIYLLQEYCRRLGLGSSTNEVRELAQTLKALPADHPIVPLLRNSPDFASEAGLADALLHPNDRAYSTPQFMDFVANAGLRFGRWLRQAPYLASCGAIAATPHGANVAALPAVQQYALMELFRGTMVRHTAILYRGDAVSNGIDFSGDEWLDYVPIRLPETIVVKERLPAGASAVLINRNHTDTDLYLPVDALRERLLEAIDGRKRIREMGRATIDKSLARDFFEQLWRWDQVVFDTTNARPSNTESIE